MSEDLIHDIEQLAHDLAKAVPLCSTRTEHIRMTQLAMKAQSLATRLRSAPASAAS